MSKFHYIVVLALLLLPSAVLLASTKKKDSPIAAGAVPIEVASTFLFTEGPACDSKGNVYFTDQPNDRIMKWDISGKLTTFLQPAGRSNGLCFDSRGDLWACADEMNEMWIIHPNGTHETIVGKFEGHLLNGPNDIWVRKDGSAFFTDPYYQRPYWKRGPKEIEIEGVYFITKDHKKVTRVISDHKQPNGIIGTPDEKILYVADIADNKTYRYEIAANGDLSNKHLFCELGSDGMTLDSNGNLYITGKGVTVFDKMGKQIEHIVINEPWTANVCFGGKDRHTLFITASTKLYTLKMRTHGVGSQ